MKIKLVTFNIRIQSPEDFAVRVPAIVKKIRSAEPDVICFQELSSEMQKVISPQLTEYTFIGGGRDGRRLGEGTPIAYKKDRFVVGEFRTRWLSDTPYVPASSFGGDQSGCPRIYTFACLTDSTDGVSIRIYNTHFDHVGALARSKEADLILKAAADDAENFPYPAVLVGDLNATPEKVEIRKISNSDMFTDVTDHFEQTFNNFGKTVNKDESKIDYVFISDGILCTETELWNDVKDGKYLSDHFAIMANIEL